MKKGLMIIASLILCFASCKKEDELGAPSKSTLEKIVGNWNGDKMTIVISYPEPLGDSTITNDFSYMSFEFKSDGTFAVDSAGVKNGGGSFGFGINSRQGLILNGDTMDILTLNDVEFIFSENSTIEPSSGVFLPQTTIFKLKK